MKFFFHYFGRCFKKLLKGVKPISVIASVALWIFFINGFRFPPSPIRVTIGIAAGLLWTCLFSFVFALALTIKDFKLNFILEKQGYSKEYLELFEREKIKDKPFDPQTAMTYAGILIEAGNAEGALKYLDGIEISGYRANVKSAYFFNYIIAALKTGNAELAEEFWKKNENVYYSAKNDAGFETNNTLLTYAMICVDCAAKRFDRALEQTENYLNSKEARKSVFDSIDFEIILLYELKMLKKDDELSKKAPAVKKKTDKWKPLFSCQKQKALDDYEKALEGKPPF